MQSDFELLEAWRDGDEVAGRDLFGRYFDAVFRFFRNKVNEAAEDLTQQTFMGLVAGRDKFRGDSSFRTYLFVIARKRLYSYLRNLDRRQDPIEFGNSSVVDLGLVYRCEIERTGSGGRHVHVAMTLTAPGCGMGPILMEDVREKLEIIPTVEQADIELVFDPPWNQSMMSEEARLQTGLY